MFSLATSVRLSESRFGLEAQPTIGMPRSAMDTR
jgi:hypothetical protein